MSPKSCNKMVIVLHDLCLSTFETGFNMMLHSYMLGDVFVKFVQPIREKNKIEELKILLKNQSYRDWFLFVLGINTGLRISDLITLRVSDLKKSHITIQEKKTQKVKRFKINAELQTYINSYIKILDGGEFLFCSKKTGRPITRVQAYRILNRAARGVGLEEIGTHTLRKTFGYHFYNQTKDIALLQQLFNHSAPSVTLRYIGVTQDILDKAIDEFSL
jgi:integrase